VKFPFALKVPNKNKKMPEMRMFHRENRKKKSSQNGRCTSKLTWTNCENYHSALDGMGFPSFKQFRTDRNQIIRSSKQKQSGEHCMVLKKYLYMSKTSVKKHYNYIPFSGKIFLSHMYIAINLRAISSDPIFQIEKLLCIARVSPASDATPHSPPAALGIAAPVRVTPPVPP